ncbi:MAG TPA: hypothetical protein DDX39_08755 [Bacteroidales bacterium]|nr:MAG: hypothetical protein A2W98_04770 [Bacteroidetes bacterium GWF2_33_38]HBF88716.1 hypothetical protein [Bacteroidales bacterium]
MNKIITILFLLLSISVLAQDKNEIAWTDSLKLTWNDFKGHSQKNNPSAAISHCSINFDISVQNDTAIIHVFNTFNKQKSWVKKNSDNDYILNHEQKHFDISEIFARMLRKQLLEEEFSYANIQKNLNKIVETNYHEAEKYQNKYDNETKHSLVVEKQEEWNLLIANQLKEFNNFTESELKVFVKR